MKLKVSGLKAVDPPQWRCAGWSSGVGTEILHFENILFPALGEWSIEIKLGKTNSLEKNPKYGEITNKDMLKLLKLSKGVARAKRTETLIPNDEKWISVSTNYPTPSEKENGGSKELISLKENIDKFLRKEMNLVKKQLQTSLKEEDITI